MKMSEAEYKFEMEHFPKNEVGESAQVETLTINGVAAEYVKGYWVEDGDSSRKFGITISITTA